MKNCTTTAIAAAFIFAIASYSLADGISSRLNIATQDGAVSTYPYKAKFSNGSVTDNGDGTVSITTGGGSSFPTGISVSTISISTIPVNQILYGGPNYIVSNSSFTIGENLGGQTGIENLKLEGLSPFHVFASSNAMGTEYFDDYHNYANAHLWGAMIVHPNAFPGIAQGNMNPYMRDGSFYAIDTTGQGTNDGGFFTYRYAHATEEATPRTVLQASSSSVMVSNMYEDCSTGHSTNQACYVDASVMFITSSTTKGSLPYPPMSSTQRNTIGSPKNGLGVWNNTTGMLDINVQGGWASFGGCNTTDTGQPTAIFNTTWDPHTALTIMNKGSTVGAKFGIQFLEYNAAPNTYTLGGIFGVMTTNGGNTQGDITIDTRKSTSDTALTEVMRITSQGALGLGTANPNAGFQVSSGTVTIDGNVSPAMRIFGSGAPPNSQALCLLAGVLGHCTSVVGVGGGCTCAAP